MGWSTADIPDQRGRTALVTGGSSGLGLETARTLADRGAHVILACRDIGRGRAAAARIGGRAEVVRLDLASLDSVREAAAVVRRRYERLDLLINNAAVMFPPHRWTADGFEAHFGVNHLGHFALTGLLLDLVRHVPGARIVTVSSLAHRAGTGRFDTARARSGNGRRSVTAYGRSKLANLLFARELQHRLAATGTAAVSVAAHPGLSATGLWNGDMPVLLRPVGKVALRLLAQPQARATEPILRAATDPLVPGGAYLGPGKVFESRGAPAPARSSRLSRAPHPRARLWELSERLTGVHYGHAPGHLSEGEPGPVRSSRCTDPADGG
ncbi:oxidoreductase [Streptomyces sp. NPDC050388]|uniref:oxidoreductase n=1 Tax=Streptomyces sp. NPDC050388 TaxID=3155781 RepID=UPI00341E6813